MLLAYKQSQAHSVVLVERMELLRKSGTPKEVVTIRMDSDTKEKLNALAVEDDSTVSGLIDRAVREFLNRRFGTSSDTDVLKIRHAGLPDTCVLHAFFTLAPEECENARQELKLPCFEFVDDRPEWSLLPEDLFTGESDIVESVNRAPIFWHVKQGGGSPRLDWIGPYLQLFVGHCIFVRRDLAAAYLTDTEIRDFEKFRQQGRTGKELSLRSAIAWARQSDQTTPLLFQKLDAVWQDAIVGCQLGTDFHIAVRRLTAILAQQRTSHRGTSGKDPALSGIVSLSHGFQEFCNGTTSAFTGNLLQSAELLTDRSEDAFLLAGPADLRVPSLNTLAGRKGMLEVNSAEEGADSRVLQFWGRAVRWFREEVINCESDANLRKFINSMFPSFVEDNVSGKRNGIDRIAVLKSLMQTWVKWFADPDEAQAFVGQGVVVGIQGGPVSAQHLVLHYDELCEMLNPSAQMKAPNPEDMKERAFWQFPVFSEYSSQSYRSPIPSGEAQRGSSSQAKSMRVTGDRSSRGR